MLLRFRKPVTEAKGEPLELRTEKGEGNVPARKREMGRYGHAPKREDSLFFRFK